MFKGKSSQRRKYFLINTNQQRKYHPKKNRNRFLNFLRKIFFLKGIFKFLKTSFILSFFILTMTGFIFFAVFSPYFKIKKININRDTPNLNIESVQKILKPFYGKNLLFLKKEDLIKILLKNFLEFRTIEITEEWPDSMTISIKLSPPAFTVFDIESANFAVISSDGVVLSLTGNEALPTLKIKNMKKPFILGDRIIEKDWLEQIKLIKKILFSEIKITTKEIILLPIAQEVHFITSSGISLWFDLQLDIKQQIQKLELGANKIGLYSKKLEHIDLRIPGQLFWK